MPSTRSLRLPWALALSVALHGGLSALLLATRATAQTHEPAPPVDVWASNAIELVGEASTELDGAQPQAAAEQAQAAAAQAPALAAPPEPASPEPSEPAPAPVHEKKHKKEPSEPRPEKPRPKKTEPPEAKPEKPEKAEKPEKPKAKAEKPEKPEAKADKPEKAEKPEVKAEKPETKAEKPEAKADKADKAEKPETPEKAVRPTRVDRLVPTRLTRPVRVSAEAARASAATARAAASAATASAAAPGSSAGGGATAGQQGPVTVRDLGLAFTRALAPAGQPDKGWAALPVGSAGSVEVALDVDAEGKLRGFTALSKEPPEQLVKLVKQALSLLRSGFFAIRGPDPTAGRQVVRLSATLSDVPKDVDGGPVALSHQYAGGRGKASFTQISGRKVDVIVELLRVDAAP